jgi:prepilin-type N-terminal cleavage/methylation domain-containing protein
MCDAEARAGRSRGRGRAGFGLVEVLLALAVGGALLAVVTEVVGRALLRWTDGFTVSTRIDRVTTALERLGRDLTGLVPIPGVTGDRVTLFVGEARRFAFVAAVPISPTAPGLAVVDYVVEAAGDGARLVRRWRRLGGTGGGQDVLLAGRLEIAFHYLDPEAGRATTWARRGAVPSGVVVAVRGATAEGGLPSELALPVPVRQSASCLVGRLMGHGAPVRRDPNAGRSLVFEQSADRTIGLEDPEDTYEPPPHCLTKAGEGGVPPVERAGARTGGGR